MEYFLKTYGPIGRQAFIIRTLILMILGGLVSFGLYEAGYHFFHFKTVGIFFAIVTWVFFGIALFIQIMRRMQDLGKPSITFCIPLYNLYLLALLLFVPGRDRPEEHS